MAHLVRWFTYRWWFSSDYVNVYQGVPYNKHTKSHGNPWVSCAQGRGSICDKSGPKSLLGPDTSDGKPRTSKAPEFSQMGVDPYTPPQTTRVWKYIHIYINIVIWLETPWLELIQSTDIWLASSWLENVNWPFSRIFDTNIYIYIMVCIHIYIFQCICVYNCLRKWSKSLQISGGIVHPLWAHRAWRSTGDFCGENWHRTWVRSRYADRKIMKNPEKNHETPRYPEDKLFTNLDISTWDIQEYPDLWKIFHVLGMNMWFNRDWQNHFQYGNPWWWKIMEEISQYTLPTQYFLHIWRIYIPIYYEYT